MCPPLPRSTLIPYTTLFRSEDRAVRQQVEGLEHEADPLAPQPGPLVLGELRRVDAVEQVGAAGRAVEASDDVRSEEHTSELQSLAYLVCRLLLEKKK